MTRNTIVPAIVYSFLLAAPALAQTYPDPIAALAHNDAPPAQMYEDIEIMRRLLDRKLGGLPDVHSADYATFVKRLSLDLTGLPAKPSDYHHLVEQYKAHGLGGSFAEGVYLPGYGVVYTVSLQGHFGPIVSAASPKPKALNEWERTRKELRGEKPDSPDAKSQESSQSSLADSVLQLLYENGRNFTALTDKKDRITVAITLSDMNTGCASCHNVGTASSVGESFQRSSVAESFQRYFAGGFRSTRGFEVRAAEHPVTSSDLAGQSATAFLGAVHDSTKAKMNKVEDDLATQTGQAQKNVLTGDLHMKQNQPRDAAKDYEQAADAYRTALRFLAERARAQGKPANKEVTTLLALAEVYIKLARAMQAAGQPDKLADVMTLADALIGELREKEKPAGPAASKPAVRLPDKLIVSAPKALFDQPGLNFADFKKQATVQYLTFSAKDAGGEKKP